MARLYKQSIVALIDILGFRNKVLESGSDHTKVKSIADLMEQAEKITKIFASASAGGQAAHPKTFHHSMFSDTILLSYQAISAQLIFNMFFYVTLLQNIMIKEGVFLRGAIVTDAHYQEGDVLFGPAIIKAYDMERAAVWPRIIVHPTTLENVKGSTDLSKYYLRQGSDGIPFLDYLRTHWFLNITNQAVGAAIYFHPPESLFAENKKAILNAVSKNDVKTEFDILTKYHTASVYHNTVIDEVCNFFPHTVSPKEPNGAVSNTNAELQGYKIDLPSTFEQLYIK